MTHWHEIATYHCPLPQKFGTPRQSGLVDDLPGQVVFCQEYNNPDLIRGIDGYDYLWLLWHCHQNRHSVTSAVVRPPRLGGNQRVGIFATRSPYRPNPIGLSSVRLIDISYTPQVTLHVAGADLVDGTPIIDIKPYLPYTDAHPTALAALVDGLPTAPLTVSIPDDLAAIISPIKRQAITRLLALDPRPAYHHDTRTYGMAYDGLNITFSVTATTCRIINITPITQE